MVFVTGDTHFPLDDGKLYKSVKGFVLSKGQTMARIVEKDGNDSGI